MSNLFSWGKAESPACPLCLKRGTLDHILSSCPRALSEGCYYWHQDKVLKAVANIISSRSCCHNIAKARHGANLKSLQADCLLELSVPWKNCIKEANERKRSMRAGRIVLIKMAGKQGMGSVGCRGFAALSLRRIYNMLDIRGTSRQRSIKSVTEAAEVALGRLWIRRGELWVGKGYLGCLGKNVFLLTDSENLMTQELNVVFDVSAYSPSLLSIVWRHSWSPDPLNGVRSLTQVPQIGHVYTLYCLFLGHISEKLILLRLMWNKNQIQFQVRLWMLVFSLLQVHG